MQIQVQPPLHVVSNPILLVAVICTEGTEGKQHRYGRVCGVLPGEIPIDMGMGRRHST